MQATRPGLASHQAGCDQHVRVGRVGAAGDGGDDDVTVAEIEVLARDRVARKDVVGGNALVRGHVVQKGARGVGQRHAVLRALRAGQAGHHGREVERDGVGEDGVGRAGLAEHALRLQICLDQRDAGLVASGQMQVVERLAVDGEEAAGGAVFRGHVGDGGAVGDGKMVERRAEELDELADHALLAKHLGDGEHEVGRGRTLRHLAGQAEADHVGDQHGDRLAEHGGFGLDAAHAPAEHAGAVDHGGVAVGAVQRVGVGERVAALLGGPDDLADVLQIDLVADAGAWRDDPEVLEGFLAPAEEGVALAVALELDGDVLLQRLRRAGKINHHRVVDDEVHGDERVHLLRVAVELEDAVSHGG